VDAQGFATTTILEPDEDTAQQRGGQERAQRDLLVQGSPAATIRLFLDEAAADAGAGQRAVTVFDPAQMWATAMIKALSDASGQPVERLLLRDPKSHATLAVVERTAVPRRQDETLTIYHADVQVPGAEMVAMSGALMERSDIVAVVVGPMHPAAIDAMIEMLSSACAGPSWTCPQLLFMLPVGALWIAQKIAATQWPKTVQVHTLSEPLTSASAVWNKLLSHWSRVRSVGEAGGDLGGFDPLALAGGDVNESAHGNSATAGAAGQLLGVAPAVGRNLHAVPKVAAAPLSAQAVADAAAPIALNLAASSESAAAATRRLNWTPDVDKAVRAMQDLVLLDGVLIAALVDGITSMAIASAGQGSDVDRAAQAAADIMRTHRRSLRQLGHWRPSDPVDEVLVTAGSRYHVLRALNGHPDHFVLCVLDKLRCNLATTRYRIMEAQQALS
jgi:hypothetical protein